MTLGRILLLTSPAALLMPLVLGIRFFQRFPLPYQALCTFVFGASAIEAIFYFLWLNHQNNLSIISIYTVFELGAISAFYALLLKKQFKVIIGSVFCLFVLYLVVDVFFISGLSHFNVYSKPIENLIIIAYAIAYFYRLFGDMKVIHLERDPDFIVNTAFLIYFSSTFFLFALSNTIIGNVRLTHLIWELHIGLVWVLYSMIALGLWKNAKLR